MQSGPDREGVFYLVWFAFLCPLSLALGTFSEEQDFSLKIAGVLLFAGLAVTGTITLCLWLTTLILASLAFLGGVVVFLLFIIISLYFINLPFDLYIC